MISFHSLCCHRRQRATAMQTSELMVAQGNVVASQSQQDDAKRSFEALKREINEMPSDPLTCCWPKNPVRLFVHTPDGMIEEKGTSCLGLDSLHKWIFESTKFKEVKPLLINLLKQMGFTADANFLVQAKSGEYEKVLRSMRILDLGKAVEIRSPYNSLMAGFQVNQELVVSMKDVAKRLIEFSKSSMDHLDERDKMDCQRYVTEAREWLRSMEREEITDDLINQTREKGEINHDTKLVNLSRMLRNRQAEQQIKKTQLQEFFKL